MSSGEVFARHYATREAVRLRWEDGIIASLETTGESPPRDLWLAPPLVDPQINGYAGIDFQQDNLTLDELLRAARSLRVDGCATWLLTLITDEWERMLARLKHLRSLRSQSAVLQRAIAGWHIEGPFLSAAPGFCGAHSPEFMCDPMPDAIHELRKVTEGDPVLLTLAPERSNAIAAIALAVSLGMRLSLGHTNAPHKRLLQAVAAGATGFTHLGNGCPRELDRFDNILWRVLETPGLQVSLIPDGIHVSPALFRLIHRTLGSESIYYTTDAMSAAGAPPGRYKIGRLELEVGEDKTVRLPGKPNLAGSALKPIEGIFCAAEMLGSAWQDAWVRFSEAPARFMKLNFGLKVGAPADFCLVEVVPQNQLENLHVLVEGGNT